MLNNIEILQEYALSNTKNSYKKIKTDSDVLKTNQTLLSSNQQTHVNTKYIRMNIEPPPF